MAPAATGPDGVARLAVSGGSRAGGAFPVHSRVSSPLGPNMAMMGRDTSAAILTYAQCQVTRSLSSCSPFSHSLPSPLANSKHPMRRQRFRTRLFLLHTLANAPFGLQGSNWVCAGSRVHASDRYFDAAVHHDANRFHENSRQPGMLYRRRAARDPCNSISFSYITTAASRRT